MKKFREKLMTTSRYLIRKLYTEIVKNNRCPYNSEIPKDILDLSEKMKEISRSSNKAMMTTMHELEMIIDCLSSLQVYYTKLESNLSISIYNIMLQNRALLWQMGLDEDVEYYNMVINHSFSSCVWLIMKKQPHLAIPKNMFQLLNYTTLPPEKYKIFDNNEEIQMTIPKLKLLFLILSQKLPEKHIESLIQRNFTICSFMFSIVLLDITRDLTVHGEHNCQIFKNLAPLYVEVHRAWYAFSCNYEPHLWEISKREGWDDKFLQRWHIYFTRLLRVSEFGKRMVLAGKNFTPDRTYTTCLLAVTNIALLPKWDMLDSWLLKTGIVEFDNLYFLLFNLLENNLKELNHDQLYSNSVKSFEFVNTEILPIVCLTNHLLEVSNKFDEETGGKSPNHTKALYKYVFCEPYERKENILLDLGIDKELILRMPELRPLVIKVLEEPLLIKLNKEFLEILQKLDMHINISSDAPHFVNLSAGSQGWGLMGVNVTNVGLARVRTREENDKLKMQEAETILSQLEKLDAHKCLYN